MNIIIVGAGRIGRNLSKSLSQENNEVYLIERNKETAQKAADTLDVKVINGTGSDPDVLESANVAKADLVLAVTTSDETNLVVCSVATSFGVPRRIARVRNTSLRNRITEYGYDKFHINEIINPELVAAQAIVKTIEAPGSSEVADFADGKLLLRGFEIQKNSPLCGSKIVEFRDDDFPWPFLIVSTIRNQEVIIPKGDTVIQAEDHIYVLLPQESLGEFLTFVNPVIIPPKKIIIYGATITGIHVAKALSGKIRDIIIVEEDMDKAADLAGKLEHVRIIHGSPSETAILNECGVEAADFFIATSKNDHSNFISSVLAKKLGAKYTIIMTQQPDYMSIVDQLDVDAIINPHYLAVEQILHFARGRGIQSVFKLLEGEAETLELIADEGAPVTKEPLKNLKFPKGSIVGAVYSGDDVHLAHGETKIVAGEKVIVFCHESAAKKLQKMFTRKSLL